LVINAKVRVSTVKKVTTPLFRDRHEAGERLAQAIVAQAPLLPVVYALPRGGLPVAAPVARQLQCPLDILVAKKITEPEQPELAIGAVTADGHVLWVDQPGGKTPTSRLRRTALEQAQQQAQAQLDQLARNRPHLAATGATAIVIDDGIATGMTMAVAVQALREQQPAEIWIATPVAPLSLIRSLNHWADQVIILATPEPFLSVSRFYQEFPQVDIEEAVACLRQSNA